MKKIALIFFVVGILALTLMFELPAREIKSLKDLDKLEVNQKIILRGEVANERAISNGKIFIVNGIEVVCDCSESFKGREVEVEGLVSEFNGKKQVEVLTLRTK